MLKIIVNALGAYVMIFTFTYIVNDFVEEKIKIGNIKNFLLLSIWVIYIAIFSQSHYSLIFTLFGYILMIILYKLILKESLVKVVLLISIITVLSFIGEMVVGIILFPFIDTTNFKENSYTAIPIYILWFAFMITITKIKKIKELFKRFIAHASSKSSISNVIFSILLIIMLLTLSIELYTQFGENISTLILIVIAGIFIFLYLMFLNEKNSYSKLMDEYDNLFQYIQTFEDWIETEQLNRHEYKNQLAVLKMMTNDKKVKKKIDQIIQDYINIDSDTVNQLRAVPNGGLKGILYYKMTIAKNNNVKLTVDVNLDKKNIINGIDEEKIKIICNLIGIYFDNAIEGTSNTKKKTILLEIYEYDEKFNIIISNTFNKKEDITKRNEKGFSTKGKDRGKGLYFAGKMVNKHKWLEEKQDVVDNYYIQKLIITK